MEDNFDEDASVEEDTTTDIEDTDDEGFMKGYASDEEVEECAECGTAIKDKKKEITREIEGEEYVFCSKPCADDFEGSMAKTEWVEYQGKAGISFFKGKRI